VQVSRALHKCTRVDDQNLAFDIADNFPLDQDIALSWSIADLSEQAPRCPLRAGSGRSVAFAGARTVYRQYTRYKKGGLRDRPPKLRLQLNELASARQTMSDIGQRSITLSEAVSYRRTL